MEQSNDVNRQELNIYLHRKKGVKVSILAICRLILKLNLTPKNTLYSTAYTDKVQTLIQKY
jgi:hypothetical protein